MKYMYQVIHELFDALEFSTTKMVRGLFHSKPLKDAVILSRNILAFAASSLLLSAIIFLGRNSFKISKLGTILIFLPFLCLVAYNYSIPFNSKAKVEALKKKYQQETEKRKHGMASLICDILINTEGIEY